MKGVVALLCLLFLSGCSVLEADVSRYAYQNKQWNTPPLYAAADVGLISQYDNPMLNTEVVRTEPTPAPGH